MKWKQEMRALRQEDVGQPFHFKTTYEIETGGHCEHIAPYRILKIEVKSLVVDHM